VLASPVFSLKRKVLIHYRVSIRQPGAGPARARAAKADTRMTPAFAINIFDFHRERCPDTREALVHQADQRTIAQADRCGHVDAIEQSTGFDRL